MTASQGCSFQRRSEQIAWCPRGCIKQGALDQDTQINSIPYFGSPAHHRSCGKPGRVFTFGQFEHFYTINVSSPAQIRCAASGPCRAPRHPRFMSTSSRSSRVPAFLVVPKRPAGKGTLCVFRRHHWSSIRETHARFAAWRPLLQKSNRILCMSISRFTATCVHSAARSNPWSCCVRRACERTTRLATVARAAPRSARRQNSNLRPIAYAGNALARFVHGERIGSGRNRERIH